MAKFKVGDKIKHKVTGNEYTIFAADNALYDLKSHLNGHMYICDVEDIDKNFELIKTFKFKVGDVIKLNRIRGEYTVFATDFSRDTYHLQSEKNGALASFNSSFVHEHGTLINEIPFTDSTKWNTKCSVCGSDAYESPFSFECSNGCSRY